MRGIVSTIILLFIAGTAFAGASYDSQRNVVTLSTLPLSGDIGWITIHNEEHVEVRGIGRPRDTGKLIGQCGIGPSLGLLVVDGRPSLNTPEVTDIGKWSDPSHEENAAAGWTPYFVLRGHDALDLMDLLHTYDTVGFHIPTGGACAETELYGHGILDLLFRTRGLERAMRRLQ